MRNNVLSPIRFLSPDNVLSRNSLQTFLRRCGDELQSLLRHNLMIHDPMRLLVFHAANQ